MKFVPHDYQRKAYDWLMDKPKSCLFLDMGMGKTVIVLTVLQDLILLGEVERILVIAPKRVAEDTWTREHAKWEHLGNLRISKVLGTAKQRMAALQRDADIYVINRENLLWLIDSHLWSFDCCVIDELSSFKSNTSKRFKALKKVIPSCSHVYGLTGTPAPQGYLDLWPEMYLIDQGQRLYRTITQYRDTYFKNVSRDPSYGIYKLLNGADIAINKRLEDVCMSMTASDYLDMPDRVDNIIHIRMSDKESKVYKELEKEAYLEMDDAEITALSAAALSNKLLQLANGFLYDAEKIPHIIHNRKIDALAEIIDTNPNEPVMVFYYYKADLEALQGAFKGARVLDNSQDISDWNDGKIPLLLAHPASMGHGLNLQGGGHIIVWYGLTWSLEVYQQACARLYRQGQTSRTVIIHHLVTEGTIDEKVVAALQSKASVQDGLMKALKEGIRDARETRSTS